MRELSLFSGAGGGLLASKYFLGWETIGYVEYEEYCQKVLKQRIADGLLDAAPIFGDIRKFISEGYAESYKGMVDVITGGFPCQDISVANCKADGIEGDQSGLWKEMYATICLVRPKYVYVENSPALAFRGLGTILGDLARIGFNAKWGMLSASTLGAPHKRTRMWIMAYSDQVGKEIYKEPFTGRPLSRYWLDFPKRIELNAESEILRIDDGMADWVDRIASIGNGQVPQCMARAWELLMEDITSPLT